MSQKLTKKLRAELIDTLERTVKVLSRNKHKQRALCRTICNQRVSDEAKKYLCGWISGELNICAYLSNWIRGQVTEYVPYNYETEHPNIVKLQQTRINWCKWMINELKEGR
jgi:hypothetical protein